MNCLLKLECREVIQFVWRSRTFTEVVSNSPYGLYCFHGKQGYSTIFLKMYMVKFKNIVLILKWWEKQEDLIIKLVLPDINSIKDMDTIVNKTFLEHLSIRGRNGASKLIVPYEHIDYFIERSR